MLVFEDILAEGVNLNDIDTLSDFEKKIIRWIAGSKIQENSSSQEIHKYEILLKDGWNNFLGMDEKSRIHIIF